MRDTVRVRLTVTGPGGHSWWDRGRPSAVHELARLLTSMIASVPAPLSVNVGLVEGGTGVNAIAARASATVEWRATDQAALDRQEAAPSSGKSWTDPPIEAHREPRNESAANRQGLHRVAPRRPGGVDRRRAGRGRRHAPGVRASRERPRADLRSRPRGRDQGPADLHRRRDRRALRHHLAPAAHPRRLAGQTRTRSTPSSTTPAAWSPAWATRRSARCGRCSTGRTC